MIWHQMPEQVNVFSSFCIHNNVHVRSLTILMNDLNKLYEWTSVRQLITFKPASKL